jgi:hypothetical protein
VRCSVVDVFSHSINKSTLVVSFLLNLYIDVRRARRHSHGEHAIAPINQHWFGVVNQAGTYPGAQAMVSLELSSLIIGSLVIGNRFVDGLAKFCGGARMTTIVWSVS